MKKLETNTSDARKAAQPHVGTDQTKRSGDRNNVSRDDEAADLPLPHERDEAAGQVSEQVDPVIEQAQRDIENGLVDTDLRGTPGLDARQREKLLSDKPR